MVLTFPASSFTSYAGTPSMTWQTTTYSVSLHQSLTFHFPWYMSFFISTTLPVLIMWYSWLYHSTIFVFGLTIHLEVSLSISYLESSSNLRHVCGHVTGAFKCAYHQEVIIDREMRMPPKHQIMW